MPLVALCARSWLLGRGGLTLLGLGASVLVTSGHAAAAEPTREPSQQEIEAWLDARGLPGDRDRGDAKAPDEAPPPPPRKSGLVLAASIGTLGHIGSMKRVSPMAPWFHFQAGYEIFRWLMLFGEADISFATTSYAARPPEPQSYAMYGGGGGLRVTVAPTDWLGIYVQGSIGAATVSEDVLRVYGYRDSTSVGPYYGASLGFEWYQVNPHLGLVLHGGVRNYQELLSRQRDTGTPLAFTTALALRYVF